MKIQFGDKGEVSWDVLLEALDKEQYLDQRHQQENCCRKCLRNFQYRCCGGSWYHLCFESGPDPRPLNGNITLDLNCLVTETANAPISADFEVERRIFWLWVKIPCLDGLGSCHYNDVCEVIPFPPSEPCPDPFPRFKLPCRCPALKGHYIVKNSTFSVPGIVSYLPSWLISGDYYVHGVAYKNSTRLGCYSVYASVSY
nr:ganglioside GM2 activator-like [Cherax quadricarinatus]